MTGRIVIHNGAPRAGKSSIAAGRRLCTATIPIT